MEKDLEGTFNLLELAAVDDLAGFEDAVLKYGANPNQILLWYHRHYALQQMGSHAVTPTMLASLFGSLKVLKFILSHTASHGSSVDSTCGSGGATPLHYAVAGRSPHALDTIRLLLCYGADANAVDARGMRPFDVVNSSYKGCDEKVEMEKLLMNGSTKSSLPSLPSASTHLALHLEKVLDDVWGLHPVNGYSHMPHSEASSSYPIPSLSSPSAVATQEPFEKAKEHPLEPASFIDVKNSIYTTDDFRMFSFKVRQCSRAYSHDWTECPFVHNGENARRRDPRKFHYSCVPCPDFRKGACRLGDACEYAHGIFESWLHPAQYRTRLCKDGIECARRVCFFAHAKNELRPLYISSGSAVPSPRGMYAYDMSAPHGPASPSSLRYVAPPLSQMQNTQKNSSPKFCLSPESMKASWIPADLPTLHFPNAGALQVSPLNVRDACMADGSQMLKGQLKSDEGFKLKNACAGVHLRANYDSLSIPSMNHVDHVFCMEGSPPRPPLSEHMPSLLMTPLQEHMQSHNSTSLQEHAQMHLETLLQLPCPSQGCSPFRGHLHSRAPMLSLNGTPMYCETSVVEAQQNVLSSSSSSSSQIVGSSKDACHLESEMHMSSSKPLSCPITANVYPSQGLSMSGWGSPTGKLEWGVHKEDLHRLRRLSTNASDVVEHPPALFAAASFNACTYKEGSGYMSVSNDESDSVLGFWLDQMQLNEIAT